MEILFVYFTRVFRQRGGCSSSRERCVRPSKRSQERLHTSNEVKYKYKNYGKLYKFRRNACSNGSPDSSISDLNAARREPTSVVNRRHVRDICGRVFRGFTRTLVYTPIFLCPQVLIDEWFVSHVDKFARFVASNLTGARSPDNNTR